MCIKSVGWAIEKEMLCRRKTDNPNNLYAVSVVWVKGNTTVGHISQKISAVCLLFLCNGGTIQCQVMERKRFSPREVWRYLVCGPLLGNQRRWQNWVYAPDINKITILVQKNLVDLDSEEIHQPRKKVKVQCTDAQMDIVSDAHDQKPWNSFEWIHLTDNDKGIIYMGLKPTDSHIHFVQSMLINTTTLM